MNRGEVNGQCGLHGSSIKSQFLADLKSGRMKLVIQMGDRVSDEFGKIPSVFDYAKNDEDRAILDVQFRQLVLGRPLAGPPDIPADRLKALREAFEAAMKDKSFLTEAEMVGLDIEQASAEQVEGVLKRFATFPPEIFRKAQEAMGR